MVRGVSNLLVCPWEQFCLTKLKFCEAVLCSWIKQPGNAYSSFAYIAVGVGLSFYGHRLKTVSAKLFGVSSIVLGVGSFIFHASGTCLGGELDYLGMFLITGVITGLNSRRLFKTSWVMTCAIILITTAALHALSCFLPLAARLIFAFGSPCCVLEVVLRIRNKYPTRYKMYWLSWGIMSIAFAFWLFDQSSFFCNPEYHWMNGHVLWHLLTAASLVPLTFFYLQFPILQTK